jgi:hypothetical protein
VVARLDRKRLGEELSQRSGTRSEAFSISRLGGSRWCLRRTRCAMGFEAAEVLAEGGERGRGRGMSTRMDGHAEAHPDVAAEG